MILLKVIRLTFQKWQEDSASLLAAALAYYIVFALGPLLLLFVYIIGFFYSQDQIQGELLADLQDAVGPQSAELIQSIIRNIRLETDRNIAGIVGSIGLSLIIFALINQVRRVSNLIWSLPKENRNWRRFVLGNLRTIASLFLLGFVWLGFFVTGNILSEINEILDLGIFYNLLIRAIQLAVTTTFFAISTQILTRYYVSWTALVAGGVLTGFLLQVGTEFLIMYIDGVSESPVYGTAGSFALLLVWIYFSAQFYIVGTEFSKSIHLIRSGKA
jgi:membrane protein